MGKKGRINSQRRKTSEYRQPLDCGKMGNYNYQAPQDGKWKIKCQQIKVKCTTNATKNI